MATPSRPSYGRVLKWSIIASVLLHLLALVLSPTFVQTEFPPGGTVSSAAPEAAFGIEAIIAVPSDNAPDVPTQETPEETQEPALRTPIDPPPAGAAGGGPQPTGESPAGADQPAGSARDALRPGYRDPRLYVPPRPLRNLEQTDHERYMEHLQARIDAVNDSMAVSARRDARTSDWTVTDDSGDRWGVSPDGLHLGGLTIPRELLPFPGATGDNQSLQAERDRERQREEIRRQEETREIDRTRNERVDAIRERQRNDE